ncbi:MAG: CPBP family intramembrane metalloprotease [Verrucomicrobia bacterium]|nr:CPBP family intramembrane metalloprotease [Verrucomicrobiota bacterium]
MTTPDILYLGLVAFALLFDQFVLWRIFLRWVGIDPGPARLRYWLIWMTLMWALVAGGAVLWIANGRAWRALGFAFSPGWGFCVAIGLNIAFVGIQGRGAYQVARKPRAREKLRETFAKLVVILPHTRTELYWFFALSLTAGFCEEFIFRGYLIWALQPWASWWGAAAIAMIVFALGHSYQGVSGIVRTAILGAVMTLVFAISNSLWPAILLHALIDIGSGLIAWLVLREQVAETRASFAEKV